MTALWLPLGTLLLVFAPGTRTQFLARKWWLWCAYPSVSRNGNDPAAQRTHELGGTRFGLIIIAAVQAVIGAASVLFDLPDTIADMPASVFVPVVQLLALPAVAATLQQWIDVGEHAAECLHAERRGIGADALAWMTAKGFDSYRDAEAWRMTLKGAEYGHMTADQFRAAMDRAAWRAEAIYWLARW